MVAAYCDSRTKHRITFFSVLDVYAAHIYSHHFSEELMTRSIVNSDGFGIRYVVTIK